MVMKKLLLLTMLLCMSLNVHAQEVASVHLDDTAHLGGSNLVLNGAGVSSKFIFDSYVAALYLTAKKSSATNVLTDAGDKRIYLHVLRDISAEDLLYDLSTAIEKNHTDAELQAMKIARQEFEMIFHTMVKVNKGDVIILDYQRGLGTQISVNGGVRGTIVSAAFNTALLKIWLGENPVQEDLKQKLLGGH
jgi:hypothetical protein